jgi:hypothetical protein
VVAFVLTRADSTSNNSHLNADYFEGTSTDPAGAPDRTRKEPSLAKQAKDARPVPSEIKAQDAAPVPARRSRISTSTLFIGGMALVFLIIGALVPLRSSKKPPDMPDPLVEPFESGPPDKTEALPPPPAAHPVRAEEPAYPQGVVIVPDAGMRQSASLDARMVGKATLRNGEQVSIMKKQRPDFGPSWVQIKTKSGKVGWVFASVVQERKARRK